MPRKTKPATLPEHVERLQPREAQFVTGVAYPAKLSPILFKLKDGTLRATRRFYTASEITTTQRSMCRLLDVSHAAYKAARAAERQREFTKRRDAVVAAKVREVRAAGYTVTKKRSAK